MTVLMRNFLIILGLISLPLNSLFALELEVEDHAGNRFYVRQAYLDYSYYRRAPDDSGSDILVKDLEVTGVRVKFGTGGGIISWNRIKTIRDIDPRAWSANFDYIDGRSRKLKLALPQIGSLVELVGETDAGSYRNDLREFRNLTPVR